MARQPMTALEWVDYLPNVILASSDGQWRIYKGVDFRTGKRGYALHHANGDGTWKKIMHADNADACKAEADAQIGAGDADA